MFKLIYVSNARKLMSSADLTQILDVSRRHNDAVGITGILLYCEGSFMQLQEGDEGEIRALYERIRADRRHTRVTTICAHQAPGRWMTEWSMAFAHLEDGDEMAGVIDLAKGLEGVKGLMSDEDSTPFTSVQFGFIERNLRHT